MKTSLELAIELISDVIKNLEDMQGEWVAVQPAHVPQGMSKIKTNVAILELVLESLERKRKNNSSPQ